MDARANPDKTRRVTETVGRLLQVRNLAVLIGAGASFHLGSPSIRALTSQDVRDFVEVAALSLPEGEARVLEALVGSTPADLENLLGTLSSSISYAKAVGLVEIPLRQPGDTFPAQDFENLRATVNAALAAACNLPNLTDLPDAIREDPWHAHREFFRRLLRSRRGDLPRVKVFTTNYDLVIEQTLDDAGITYFDGFVGTVRRTFAPRAFGHELFLPAPADDRRMLRLEDVVYLYKLHGSINWRSEVSGKTMDIGSVLQVPQNQEREPGELALIYPTPHKELDVLGFPYAELFRALADVVTEPETALLVIGYSFGDEHINRIIFQALASNPTLQLFVVDPFGVVAPEAPSDLPVKPAAQTPAEGMHSPQPEMDAQEKGTAATTNAEAIGPPILLETRLGRLASVRDARIAIFTGAAAKFVNFAGEVMPDPEALASNQEGVQLAEGALKHALLDALQPPDG